MGDTVLQMGRWFGHKNPHGSRFNLHARWAAERFPPDCGGRSLSSNSNKDAIFKDLKPDEIL